MREPPPESSEALRKALERNLSWIKDHIPALAGCAKGSPRTQQYVHWIFERLKDRLPPNPNLDELDRLVRAEVRKLFFGGRSRQPPIVHSTEDLDDVEDQSALRFVRALETADEVRACLDCLSEETRDLVIEAYTLTEGDLAGPGLRERIARKLGISRDTLDQRLSRAIRRIRERMPDRPGPKAP